MNDEQNSYQSKRERSRPAGLRMTAPGGIVAKIVALFIALLVVALAFAFSLVLLAVAAVAGIVAWVYFKFRAAALLRERTRDDPTGAEVDGRAAPDRPEAGERAAGGRIIEGEARREDAPPADPDASDPQRDRQRDRPR